MGEIHVSAEQVIHAPAERVYRIIADYRQHHPNILPPAFSDLRVEEGGVGEGTVISFKMTAGGRTRQTRARVTEPEPGRVLVESGIDSSVRTSPTGTRRSAHTAPARSGSGARRSAVGQRCARARAPTITLTY